MKRIVTLLILTCAWIFCPAQVKIIKTIAGNDTPGYAGDGKLSIYSELNRPNKLCLDKSGNLFIADAWNNRVRKISLQSNIISTIAGSDTGGFAGDGGPVTAALLKGVNGIIVDSIGNVYISDFVNRRVRKIDISTGVISSVAGNGVVGNSGDGGLAIDASIHGPEGLHVDNHGNLFIVDANNNNIRKVDATNGIISTVADDGNAGYSGDGGNAIFAELNFPASVSTYANDNIFICDGFNSCIRRVDALTGIITTYAGNGDYSYYGDGGPATNAAMKDPNGLFIDKQNNVYVAEWGNRVIRKIDATTGIITTVVGVGAQGFSGDGGPASAARLIPDDVCIDTNGTMYIADYGNNRIRMVYDPQLAVSEVNSRPDFILFPNPAKDVIIIEHAKDELAMFYDVQGNNVLRQLIKSQKEKIDLSALANGFYVIEIKGVRKKLVLYN